MEYIEQLKQAVIEGDEDLAVKLTNEIIENDIVVDIKKTLETIGKKFVILAGNIPATRLLRGTPEEIELITKKCRKAAGNNGKYAICPGCDLAPGTPKENIMAFIKAAKKYGKFPIKTNN
ncbi:MAG: uroporphyrinogen decarboxylase family protein [Promethearchaeota archaeon]